MEFSRHKYCSGLPFPSPGDRPNPGIEPKSPALQADSLPSELPGKPQEGAEEVVTSDLVIHTVLPKAPSLVNLTFQCIAQSYWFSLQCVYSPWLLLLSRFSRVRLFVIPWTVSRQAPLSMEFSRHKYCSGLPFPSPGDRPHPWTEPRSPALLVDS